ncbi:transcriptional regulator, ArsR family [Cryptosporangium aurantiacum]|uniref:Transcriptional regulator, ArsR family n=1 Tax=Cryptosporangium aurantiacum TaxID=134849 RepID=A0A1M7RNP6_9ACTN|nr:winged helix-turn-helix domain-containing protein [Cryptosporangium aurantiacum]SHN47712.1 transcriptional regulator, ArsR family [Cryptosporangium aurantiacum]
MTTARGLASFATLLADETRAAMCLALLDGRAWTAGELAAHATVARSTASEQLHRLVEGGLLVERRQGRHRYVQLADPSVAYLLEDLAARAVPRPAPPRGLRAVTADAALRRGRTCYDHLAGRLGVAVTDAMADAGLLDRAGGLALTPAGKTWLTGTLGVDPAELAPGRRPLTRGCLDWTERREHVAGRVGVALCETFRGRGWGSGSAPGGRCAPPRPAEPPSPTSSTSPTSTPTRSGPVRAGSGALERVRVSAGASQRGRRSGPARGRYSPLYRVRSGVAA